MSVLGDDGKRREEFVLDRPNVGLHAADDLGHPAQILRRRPAGVRLALRLRRAGDYIRDYDEYLALTKATP